MSAHSVGKITQQYSEKN